MAGPVEILFQGTKYLFTMIWSALILGLMGSIHCLAMCGPLVLTLNAKKRQTSLEKFYYNAGRIFTYCLLGALAGLFGSGLEWAIGQQFLSIFSGLLLLSGLLFTWIGTEGRLSWISKLLVRVKLKMGKLLNGGSRNMWWFGVYNGMLPCGLTYVALAAAISAGNLFQSVLYMALFGIGTSPMMWMIVSSFQRLKLSWVSGNKIVRIFTWVLAILLIIRGLDLGVPYLSPDVNSKHTMHTAVCD